MSFPLWPIPYNWLSVMSIYHAYAYGVPDSPLPYSFTGDISANTSAQWSAITWTDVRPQPSYATLSDPAFLQEGLNALGGYLASVNQLADHAQIATNTSGISSLTTTVSSLAAGVTSAQTVTTSPLSVSLVGSGATGTQVHATKNSNVKFNISTQTTSSIGGPGTSLVALKICATNSSTEANWTTVATLENDQTITLAITLNSIQTVKGQLSANVPVGYYVKLVNSGTGTHAESFISGQQTIYG